MARSRGIRDVQRSRVYAWEHTIKGYHRPPQWRTIDEVIAFARPIWSAERGRYGKAGARMPDISHSVMGQTSALAHGDSRITLPLWARQAPVVLHEMAHCLTPRDEAHGPRFVGVLIGLLSRHAGYVADELMAAADAAGVRYNVRSIGSVPIRGIGWMLQRALREERPMTEMDLACWLDVSYMQVRGGAMSLIRAGQARWLRGRLVPMGDLLPPAAPPPRKPRVPSTTSVQATATRHGIEIDRMTGGGFMVYPPTGIADTAADPWDGDHWADDWSQVRTMVMHYAAQAEGRMP